MGRAAHAPAPPVNVWLHAKALGSLAAGRSAEYGTPEGLPSGLTGQPDFWTLNTFRERYKRNIPSELMPQVHHVISLLKRWLMGTLQGAVSLEHLDYYLDESTFRFNRRRSAIN